MDDAHVDKLARALFSPSAVDLNGDDDDDDDDLVLVPHDRADEAALAMREGRLRPRVLLLQQRCGKDEDDGGGAADRLLREAVQAGTVLLAATTPGSRHSERAHWTAVADDADEATTQAEHMAAWLLAQPEEGMRSMIRLTGAA